LARDEIGRVNGRIRKGKCKEERRCIRSKSLALIENLLFTIYGRQHQIRNNRIQKNIDKTTHTV